MEHAQKPCNCNGDTHCQFCDGGLFVCEICKGAEGTLTTKCPGEPITDRWLACFVYYGKYDYIPDMLGGHVWAKRLSKHGGEYSIVNKFNH